MTSSCLSTFNPSLKTCIPIHALLPWCGRSDLRSDERQHRATQTRSDHVHRHGRLQRYDQLALELLEEHRD
jgi:hypothetical protein